MRLGLFSSMAALLAGTGLALGQTSAPTPAGSPASGPGTVSSTTMTAPPGMPPAMPSGPVSSGAPPTYMGPSHDGGSATGDCSVGPGGYGGGGIGEGGVLHTILGEHSDGSWEPKQYHIWGGVEYLLWRFGGSSLPALNALTPSTPISVSFGTETIGTGPMGSDLFTAETAVATVAATVNLGVPGGNFIDFKDQPGIRFTTGAWLDSEQRWGIDGSFFMLWRKTVGFSSSTPPITQEVDSGFANQVLAPANGLQAAQVLSTTPILVGAVVSSAVNASASNEIWGTDLNVITRAYYFGPITVDFLGGLRYIDIDQKLTLSSSVTISPDPAGPQTVGVPGSDLPGTVPLGAFSSGVATVPGTVTSTTFDYIDAHDRFYGAQVGAVVDWRLGYGIDIFGFGKMAVGDMHETFSLQGGSNSGFTESLIVNKSETGAGMTRDRFSYVPEINLNLGYEVTSNIRVYVGYNAIFFSSVAKVADQLTTAKNTTNITFGNVTNPAIIVVPGFNATGTKATLQGFNAGAEIRF